MATPDSRASVVIVVTSAGEAAYARAIGRPKRAESTSEAASTAVATRRVADMREVTEVDSVA
jgi:hypothetical protein